jgi:hypothetical protein
MAIKKLATDFATGFMGGNYKVTPATVAGNVTRKGLRSIANGVVFLAKRNPAVAIAGGVAATATGLFKGADKLAEKLDTKINEGQAEDTTDVPDYLNAKGSDYKEKYKNYWKQTLGHDGMPKQEDFQNLGDGYDPEVEFSQALRLYYDSKPL